MKSIQSISKLGYGCYALSGVYGNTLTKIDKIKLIQKAYEEGITFFDTASQYNTEEILGVSIETFRKDVMISTKVGLTKDNVINLTKPFIINECERSLKRLKTDYIDLYQLHYYDPNTSLEETVDALETLKKEGKIINYGLGHLPLEQTKKILSISNPSTITIEMNAAYLHRYQEIYPLIKDKQIKLIPFSITARGLLTGAMNKYTEFKSGDIRSHDPLFKRKRLEYGLKIADKIKKKAKELNKTPVQIAIAWVLKQEAILSALTGPTNLNHLQENIDVLNWDLKAFNLSDLNEYILKNHALMNESINQEVNEILTTENSKFDVERHNLIYVLEHLLDHHLISYKKGTDLYLKLLSEKNDTRSTITQIKAEIKAMID